MDPEVNEVKSMLAEMLKLSRENNDMLHKVYRKMKWAEIYKAIYWFVILGIAFGGFYFMKPYFGSIFNYYNAIAGESGMSNMDKSSTSLLDVKHLQDLLKQVGGQ